MSDNQNNIFNSTPNIDPKNTDSNNAGQNLAINLIRNKLDTIYDQEPETMAEENLAINAHHRSKHQQFMYELTTSGKNLVQIQTAWHKYYLGLSDEEKKQVWKEFYSSNQNTKQETLKPTSEAAAQQIMSKHIKERAITKVRTTRRQLRSSDINTSSRQKEIKAVKPKLTWKHHLQSALFGLSIGAIGLIIMLFGFFNEVIIAPFIQPSRNPSATPIIISTNTVTSSGPPQVIIPKINVEIPVDYSVNTTNENTIENDLQAGVVHYPTTSFPGQTGNAAFFGHSSNNILNPGKYKFAFVLLHELTDGDVFYLTYKNTVYAYKVFQTSIVVPSDVSVLNPIAGHPATATLITCDPPGTSLNRLVVSGDQISPNPIGDIAPSPNVLVNNSVTQLPGNGPSLWHRFISTIWGKLLSALFIIGIIYVIWRWYSKEFSTK